MGSGCTPITKSERYRPNPRVLGNGTYACLTRLHNAGYGRRGRLLFLSVSGWVC